MLNLFRIISMLFCYFSPKVSLKIADTEWSDKFSLDTVGSSGNIQCKSKSKTYEVSKHSLKSHDLLITKNFPKRKI